MILDVSRNVLRRFCMRNYGYFYILVLAAIILVVPISVASADPPVTFHEVITNWSVQRLQRMPCIGEPGAEPWYNFSISGLLTEHLVEEADGREHVIGIDNYRVEADPLDPTLPTYSGRYVTPFSSFDDLDKSLSLTKQTLNVRMKGDDGSKIHLTALILFQRIDGETIVDIREFNCH